MKRTCTIRRKNARLCSNVRVGLGCTPDLWRVLVDSTLISLPHYHRDPVVRWTIFIRLIFSLFVFVTMTINLKRQPFHETRQLEYFYVFLREFRISSAATALIAVNMVVSLFTLI